MFNDDRTPVDQPNYPIEQQHLDPVDVLPVELVEAQTSEQSNQTGFIETSARQVQGTTTSNTPKRPCQISNSPEQSVSKGPGARATSAPEPEASQTSDKYNCTVQHARSVEMVTIDPGKIRHFFTVYVSSPPDLSSC